MASPSPLQDFMLPLDRHGFASPSSDHFFLLIRQRRGEWTRSVRAKRGQREMKYRRFGRCPYGRSEKARSRFKLVKLFWKNRNETPLSCVPLRQPHRGGVPGTLATMLSQ